jgi:hypothetical protein
MGLCGAALPPMRRETYGISPSDRALASFDQCGDFLRKSPLE